MAEEDSFRPDMILRIDAEENSYEVHSFSASEPETMNIILEGSFDFHIPLDFVCCDGWWEPEQREETYGENMLGMTLDEFQAWSDQVIRDAKEDSVE